MLNNKFKYFIYSFLIQKIVFKLLKMLHNLNFFIFIKIFAA